MGHYDEERAEWYREMKETYHEQQHRRKQLVLLREAIQRAEEFGPVRTEEGEVITGVRSTVNGFVLTKE